MFFVALQSQRVATQTHYLMVTHNKYDATFAQRIINLFDGQIVDNVGDFV